MYYVYVWFDLTERSQNKMAEKLQTTFLNAFFRMEFFNLRKVFILGSPTDTQSVRVQAMAGRRTCKNPLLEPMVT